jgi:hypothetical protein
MTGLRWTGIALCGAAAGAGAWLLLTSLRRRTTPTTHHQQHRRRSAASGPPLPAVAVAGLAGLVVGLLVGMPVLGLIGAGAVWVWAEATGAPNVPEQNELGDAVATWCETVRQELDAGQPLRAAVAASCQLPPPALAGPLAVLRRRLDDQPLPDALRGLRGDIPHPVVGSMVAALLLAYRHGAGDLATLMAEQVETTRHRVAVLRDLHAARARHRRAMVLLVGLFAVSTAALLAVWPAMLTPYRSLLGQLVLAGVVTTVGFAVRALLRLSRPAVTPDFFGELT